VEQNTESLSAVEAAEDAVQDAAHAVEAPSSEAESLVNSVDASAETVGQAADEVVETEVEAAEATEVVEVVADDIIAEAAAVAEVAQDELPATESAPVADEAAEVEETVVVAEDDVVAAVDVIDFEDAVDEDAQLFIQSMDSMADLVDDFQYKPLKAGDVRDGIIVSISPSEILVDVGAKSEGFVHQREMERMGKEYLDNLSVGESVVVYVVRPEDRDGNIVLSLSRAQQEREQAIDGPAHRPGQLHGLIPRRRAARATRWQAKAEATRTSSQISISLPTAAHDSA
jgi:predicted RNA-binding protein with RPS1 domain